MSSSTSLTASVCLSAKAARSALVTPAGVIESAEDIEQRHLVGTLRSHQADNLAALRGERYAAKRLDGFLAHDVRFVDVVHGDDGICRH
jgi:hypothetical protein